MSKLQDRMEKLIEALVKEGALENFVYGLMTECLDWEGFPEVFVEMAVRELHPDEY